MSRAGRIFAVTLGLSVAGAIFGSIAGVIAVALIFVITGSGGSQSIDLAQVLLFPALIGGAIGAVAAPAAAWLLLRHVPLGKAVVWSAVGSVLGGVAGWIASASLQSALQGPLPLLGDTVRDAILGAIAGFLVTAFLLRLRAPRGVKSQVQPPDA